MEQPERLSVRITGANSIEIVAAGDGYRLPHGVEYVRTDRPKREPTEEEMKECWAACYRSCNSSADIEAAIRRAFELAQEPK